MPLLFWLLLIAAVALWARRSGRAVAPWAASLAWLALPGYELWLRKGCSGDCGIRIDLLVVVPVLLALTIAALWRWRQGRRRSTRGGPG